MSNPNYLEKLKNPRWQKKRLEILQRDEFTCQKCGDKETTLNIHHKSYKLGNDPWDYPDDNLITLCEHCHGYLSIRINPNYNPKFDDVLLLKYKQDDGQLVFIGQIKNRFAFFDVGGSGFLIKDRKQINKIKKTLRYWN